MSNITFNSFAEEKKVANAGGLVTEKFSGKTATLTFNSPWAKKDGSIRTKSGSLGVNTSEGWLNASAVIAFLETLGPTHPSVQKLIKVVQAAPAGFGAAAPAAGFELVVDPSLAIQITFDAEGKIAAITC
jgi:hypothetical protein